jgi:hypothetical protein
MEDGSSFLMGTVAVASDGGQETLDLADRVPEECLIEVERKIEAIAITDPVKQMPAQLDVAPAVPGETKTDLVLAGLEVSAASQGFVESAKVGQEASEVVSLQVEIGLDVETPCGHRDTRPKPIVGQASASRVLRGVKGELQSLPFWVTKADEEGFAIGVGHR